ncbi:DUF1177 domain-containing protein [Salinicola rhizosphaerae]|uniref:DUF1177 domain-containing protein n=1 Tax=Salinicola rhizosphaerae TaxID=1443141 RepID=A0ABQ3DVQ6_9GAMM|nr:DUF1177 domain-containing protein [Salinicola rhizosphaerae]GHB14879.1 hypothetical protein GCM10009038_11720 [Salinicola rhizosphaerae]
MLKQVIDLHEILDSPSASGERVKAYLVACGAAPETVKVTRVTSEKGASDFLHVVIAGHSGKQAGGDAPTLGVIGRLGGIGARPEIVGYVSDGDGALAASAAAAKLIGMAVNGDRLAGDVIVTTHICPDAPTREHHPVPFMDSPISFEDTWEHEIDPAMDAIVSIDTTKGNRIINVRGVAMSPTVKQGYILRTSESLMDVMSRVTGRLPEVFALTQQDITPYGNGLHHLNSILQPAVATTAPVVGVALAAETAVAGCATGASHEVDIEQAARFAVEVAKDFTAGLCQFFDAEEYALLVELYGEQTRFQQGGARG